MRRSLFILSISCLTGFLAHAQRSLSLQDAITTSLANNYDIALSRNDSTLAALDDAFSIYALLPTLSANGGVNFNNVNSKQVLADGTKRERSGIKSTNSNASHYLTTIEKGIKTSLGTYSAYIDARRTTCNQIE